MISLTDRAAIATLDKSNMLGSIEQLPDQISDAHQVTKDMNNHHLLSEIDNVVVTGMGGSALGARVIRHLAGSYLTRPLEIVSDYHLPGYVNNRTLVVLSSYSGNTEETLSCATEALHKGSKLAVVASGGDLAQFASLHQCPSYIINPVYNPSNQPRMAIGYAITGQIGLLNSYGLLGSYTLNIENITRSLRESAEKFLPESANNPAIQLASASLHKTIFLVSAEHLVGAVHVVNNQINENSKNLTVELVLPELNHHYMEGLPHPNESIKDCIFWFFGSKNYSPKLQLRTKLTIDVVNKINYQHKLLEFDTNDPATEAFLAIQLGAYANFYLAMMHEIDPAPIPWVDYFKEQLKAQSS
jgi:glucose/mannose-6-phosphate isomerase